MSATLAGSIRDEMVALFSPLSIAGSPAGFRVMLESLGHTGQLSGNDPLRVALSQAAALVAELSAIDDATLDSMDGVAKVLTIGSDTLSAVRAVEQAVSDPSLAALAAGLGQQIIARLVALQLRSRHPQLHRALSLLTLINPAETAVPSALVVGTSDIVRLPVVDDVFQLNRLPTLISHPGTALRGAYFPNGLAGIGDAYAAADLLFPLLGMLANEVGLRAYRELFPLDPTGPPFMGDMLPGDHVIPDLAPDDPNAVAVDPNVRRSRYMPRLTFALLGANGSPAVLNAGVVMSSAKHPGNVAGAIVTLQGGLAWSQSVGAWVLDFKTDGQVPAFVVGPSGIALAPVGSPVTGASGHFTATRASSATPAVVIGNAKGTRLEIGKVQFGVDFSLAPARSAIDLTAAAENAALTIAPADMDSFVASLLPSGGLRVPFDLGLVLSSDKGLVLKGQVGLAASIPVALSVGGLELTSVNVGLSAGLAAGGTVGAEVSADVKASIGPVHALIGGLGLAGTLRFPPNGGNLGVADLSLGFKPPTQVGLSIDVASVVT
ncbi:MAG: hypothetical protein ABI664_20760, partial [bacterium]